MYKHYKSYMIIFLACFTSHFITLLYIHYIASLVHFFSLHRLITVVLISAASLLPSSRSLDLCCLDVEETVAGICEAMPVSECLKSAVIVVISSHYYFSIGQISNLLPGNNEAVFCCLFSF